MVKTSPCKAGGAGSIPSQEAKISHILGPKTQNLKQKQYCNKLKTLKMVHIKKKKTLGKKRKTVNLLKEESLLARIWRETIYLLSIMLFFCRLDFKLPEKDVCILFL